jgi:hypothetical protein
MRLSRFLCSSILLSASLLSAESKNPADYPFRLHIFNRSETDFYGQNRVAEETKGEGRANLFANNDVRGIDFSYECSEKLKASFGYETYPAKWKKPNQELVVLMPVFGKPNAYFTCDFKTQVKDYAYVSHNGSLSSESPADFKEWMKKRDYDPEHGKNVPTKAKATTAAATSSPQ